MYSLIVDKWVPAEDEAVNRLIQHLEIKKLGEKYGLQVIITPN
jgi:hypothetical protein